MTWLATPVANTVSMFAFSLVVSSVSFSFVVSVVVVHSCSFERVSLSYRLLALSFSFAFVVSIAFLLLLAVAAVALAFVVVAFILFLCCVFLFLCCLSTMCRRCPLVLDRCCCCLLPVLLVAYCRKMLLSGTLRSLVLDRFFCDCSCLQLKVLLLLSGRVVPLSRS